MLVNLLPLSLNCTRKVNIKVDRLASVPEVGGASRTGVNVMTNLFVDLAELLQVVF